MAETQDAIAVLSDQKLDYERAVLGACLIDEKAWEVAEALLSPSDFSQAHKGYWKAMLKRAGDGGTAPLLQDVVAEFKSLPGDNVVDYALGLADSVSRSSHVGTNVAALKEVNGKLHLLEWADKMTANATAADLSDLIIGLEAQASNLKAVSANRKPEYIDAKTMMQGLGTVEWLWKHWLPRGFVSMVGGHTGKGKSLIVQALVSGCASGNPWPDGQKQKPVGVVWYEAEGKQLIWKDRANKFGYAVDNIYFPGKTGHERYMLDRPDDVAKLQGCVRDTGAKLLIVDALFQAHGQEENSEEIKHVIRNISELAKTEDISILVIHHFRKKDGQRKSDEADVDDLRGSSAIAGAVAVLWLLDQPDPENDMLRLRVGKTNLSEPPDAIGFWVDGDGAHFETNQDLIPRCPKKKLTAVEMGCELVKAALRRGPKPYQELKAACEAAGVTDSTLNRVKQKLNLVSIRQGFGKDSGTLWSLPARMDDDDDPLAEVL